VRFEVDEHGRGHADHYRGRAAEQDPPGIAHHLPVHSLRLAKATNMPGPPADGGRPADGPSDASRPITPPLRPGCMTAMQAANGIFASIRCSGYPALPAFREPRRRFTGPEGRSSVDAVLGYLLDRSWIAGSR
jgi:hypothetical protein